MQTRLLAIYPHTGTLSAAPNQIRVPTDTTYSFGRSEKESAATYFMFLMQIYGREEWVGLSFDLIMAQVEQDKDVMLASLRTRDENAARQQAWNEAMRDHSSWNGRTYGLYGLVFSAPTEPVAHTVPAKFFRFGMSMDPHWISTGLTELVQMEVLVMREIDGRPVFFATQKLVDAIRAQGY